MKREKLHPFYQGHTYENGDYWNGHVTKAVFIYGFMEMVSRAMIFCAAYLAVRHGIFIYLFYVCGWVEVADMLDYWLFRNDPYPFIPKIGNFGLEYNYIKIGIILYFALADWNRPAP